MSAYIILGLALGLPLLLGLLFRVSTSYLFFSLMAGELLARYFGPDAEAVIDHSATTQSMPAAYGEVLIVVLPMLVTAVMLKGSLSKAKTVLHVIPLAFTGVILAAFTLPMLPENIKTSVSTIPAGYYLLNLHKSIIGIVVLLQLVTLWLLNRNGARDNKLA